MLNLFKEIKSRNLSDCLSDTELKNIISGTDDRRQAIIKRALARGDLIRLRRGLYCVSELYRTRSLNLFSIAQKIYGPSYVSMESALSYHGMIPESVMTVTSASVYRSRVFKTPLGVFSFTKIPAKLFFDHVERVEENGTVFFIARPWKAIVDYVYCHRKKWKGIHPLIHDLRISEDDVSDVSKNELEEIDRAFGKRRISSFIAGVIMDLKL